MCHFGLFVVGDNTICQNLPSLLHCVDCIIGTASEGVLNFTIYLWTNLMCRTGSVVSPPNRSIAHIIGNSVFYLFIFIVHCGFIILIAHQCVLHWIYLLAFILVFSVITIAAQHIFFILDLVYVRNTHRVIAAADTSFQLHHRQLVAH